MAQAKYEIRRKCPICGAVGDSYTANNSLINKALAIGLKELKEQDDIMSLS